MLYTATLVLHIIVACVSIAALVYTVYALVRGKHNLYTRLMISIALLTTLETISGFSLAVLSPTVTVSYVASHLVWYLGLCIVAEAALAVRMRKVWIG